MTTQETAATGAAQRDGASAQPFELVNPVVRAFKRRATEQPDEFWAEAAE